MVGRLSRIRVVGYFLLASFALSEPLPNRIAEDPTIRGKGKDGECMDYAIAVSSKLAPTEFTANLSSTAGTSAILQLPVVMSLWCTVYRTVANGSWTTKVQSLKRSRPMRVRCSSCFLLSGDPSAPVDVELQNGLNHLSFF